MLMKVLTLLKICSISLLGSIGVVSALNYAEPNLLSNHPFLRNLASKLDVFQTHTAAEKVYLQMDKPFYKPGESIWFSAYVRDAQTLQKAQSRILYVELLNPKGAVEKTITLVTVDGQAAGDFQLPADAKGGIYKLRAYTQWQKNTQTVFERDLTVQAVVLPNLNMKLDFERESYGAGEEFSAFLDLASLDNKVLQNYDFQYVVSINGEAVATEKGKTDANGRAFIRYKLPKNLNSNDALLNVILSYKGQNESISRSVPILLGDIDLQFFPESGDLLADNKTRLAFKALNEFGKPADIQGVINDSKGNLVATFSTYHQGMGNVEFTPKAGETYSAQIQSPILLKTKYAIPTAKTSGYNLRVDKQTKNTISLTVISTQKEELFLAVQARNQILFSEVIAAQAGENKIEIPVDKFPVGIAQISLFDSQQQPRAERLVFTNPHKQLKINVKTDKEKYLPREKVEMTVAVSDENGNPVQGNFSMSVADDKLLTFADDKQGHILSAVLLEGDLKGKVEEPNFYFDNESDVSRPKPEISRAQAVDNLLLTQGWRGFEWKKVQNSELPAFSFQPEKGLVTGMVVDHKGNALPNTTVQLTDYRNGVANHYTKSNEKGYFELDNVTPYGKLYFQITNLNFYQTSVEYFGDFHNNLHLIETTPYKFVSGVILRQNGKPVPNLLIADEDEYFATVTDKNGRFSMPVKNNYWKYLYIQDSIDIKTEDMALYFSDSLLTPIRILQPEEKNKIRTQISIWENRTVDLNPIIVESERPIVNVSENINTRTMIAEDIRRVPTRSVSDLRARKAGVVQKDAGEETRAMGSRAGSDDIYIDGVRMFGIASIPETQIEAIQIGGTKSAKKTAKKPIEQKKNEAEELKAELTTTGKNITSTDFKVNEQPAAEKSLTRYYLARKFYAPKYEQKQENVVRNDFRSTIYFNPTLKTNEKGEAKVEFYSSDDISQFRVTMEGFGKMGEIGRTEYKYFSQQPLEMTAKVPAEVLSGDVLSIPLTVSNNSEKAQNTKLSIALPTHLAWVKKPVDSFELKSKESKTILLEMKVLDVMAEENLLILIKTNDYSDKMISSIKSRPRGFPAKNILLGQSKKENFMVEMPTLVEGSQSVNIKVRTSFLDEAMGGVESMLRMPSGCFEQVSSTTFPNILAIKYLRSSRQTNPKIENLAKTCIEDGYVRLTGYQCTDGGYNYYGGAISDVRLTAYGIVEFKEMSEIINVAPKYIKQPAEWLLSQKSAWGDKTKYGYSASKHIYILWALQQAGFENRIADELNSVFDIANNSNDAFMLALAIELLKDKNAKKADMLMSQMLKLEQVDKNFAGAGCPVGYSYGTAAKVETNSAVLLTLTNSDKANKAQIQGLAKLVINSKNAYGFGSTQSSVWALSALSAASLNNKKVEEDGQIVVKIDGQIVEKIAFEKGQKEILIPELSSHFTGQKHNLEVEFLGCKEAIPFDVEVFYNRTVPQNSDLCKLKLETKLSEKQTTVGQTVRLSASLQNKTAENIPMPMIMVGIPAGLSVQHWQLKEMQEKWLFDYYEMFEGYVVLHFINLKPNEIRNFNFDLKADIAGTYEAPASTAFMYYTQEYRHWANPETVVIQ